MYEHDYQYSAAIKGTKDAVAFTIQQSTADQFSELLELLRMRVWEFVANFQ